MCTCSWSSSTTSIGVIKNVPFDPSDPRFFLTNLSLVYDQTNCKCRCFSFSMCITATYFGLTRQCSLFSAQLWQGKLTAVSSSQNTSTIIIQNKSVAVYGVNLLMNGDGEMSPCAISDNVTHPTGWSYIGKMSQISYNNTAYGSQFYSTPEPSDRGNCYFVGQNDQNTSIFQTLNLNGYAVDIDNRNVSFNLSAWIGGWTGQNDTATISVDFFNSLYQIVGNRTTIGPVFDSDRGGITSLVFRQKVGIVPITTRYMSIIAMLKYTYGPWNDASVDNIRIDFKRF